MNPQGVAWLMLLYSLPAEPSGPRVQTWRRIRELGALRLPAGGYVLPDHQDNRSALTVLGGEITANGGAVAMFQATPLTPEFKAELEERYNAARRGEYADIERACGRLRDHIQREIEHFVFTYEEIEELDAECKKIQQQLEHIQRRDVFGVPERAAAATALASCAELLASFATQVFEHDASERPGP